MRRIPRRTAALAIAAWLLFTGFGWGDGPTPRARGGLRPAAAFVSKDREPHDAPEWSAPPIEMAPPWVGDGTPSKDRVLKLDPPRVRILSIESVFVPSDLMPAGQVQKR